MEKNKYEIIELARQAKGGDKRAFEELCKAKTRSIIYNAKSILGNMDDAMDIYAEAMIAMYKGIKKLRSPEAVDMWVLQITRNLANKLLSKRGKYIWADSEEYMNIEDNDGDFIPERYVANDEFTLQLTNIVDHLPRARREAIILYYYNGLSYDEISKLTGVSEKTVSTNLTRARKMIKAELIKEYPEMNRNGQGTNLGKAIIAGSFVSIPETTVIATQAKGSGLLHAYIIKNVVKSAVIALVSTSVVGVGIYGAVHETTPPPEINPPGQTIEYNEQVPIKASEEVYKPGEIAFSGGWTEYPHVNPKEAKLKDIVEDYERISWSILGSNSKIVLSGEGETIGDDLKSLSPGVYTIEYVIYYPEGFVTHKDRDFEIIAVKK